MDVEIEWGGITESIDNVALGTCFGFNFRRKGTQWALRVDELFSTGETKKGLVSLTTGYEDRSNGPAFFQLSAFGSNNIVYSMPDAKLALATDQKHIYPGRYGIELEPRVIARVGEQTLLIVAYNSGMRFVDVVSGTIAQNAPNFDGPVLFSAWSIVRRQGDESKTIFEFPPPLPSPPLPSLSASP